MALASLLEPQLPANGPGFFGLGAPGPRGEAKISGDLTLAAPYAGLFAGDAKIELEHGTTTLAFKVSRRRGRQGRLERSWRLYGAVGGRRLPRGREPPCKVGRPR